MRARGWAWPWSDGSWSSTAEPSASKARSERGAGSCSPSRSQGRPKSDPSVHGFWCSFDGRKRRARRHPPAHRAAGPARGRRTAQPAHSLEGILAPLAYDLRRATTGAEALEKIAAAPPDIVLLDVMMPGLSGFDVCRQLKSQPETQFIPVVLVTALADRESRVTGIEVGADDFINKPVDPNELRARAKSLLRSKGLYDELQRSYEELRRLEMMREALTQMIVHDLRTPLGAIMGYLELMTMKGYVSKEEAAQRCFRVISRSGQTLIDMITAMLDLARLEADEMRLDLSEVDLGQVVSDVEMGMGSLLENKKLTFEADLPGDLPSLRADREMLRRILVNILGNAITFSPETGRIAVAAHLESGKIRIAVRDEGPGIPAEYRERIFEKFGQVENCLSGKKYSTGLGLAFCKMAVEAHGGQIGAEGEEGKGSTFWFTLPAAQ
ncbi:MAG: response regulator [Candidatus Latescibacteria bacterium]|nr:response regulator [Candidatus Latescibacterota bacterium]